MPLVLAPHAPPPNLPARLGGLRRRKRRAAAIRGVSTVAATIFATFVVVGTIDYFLKAPSVFRAIALLSLIVGIGALIQRLLLRPWRQTRDDLTLALHVESRFPALNDALASAIAFRTGGGGSEAMRQETRRRAERAAEDCDFDNLIESRGPRLAALACTAALAVAVTLFVLYPTAASTAAVRLADPFGAHPWPLKTELDVEAPTWIARGDPFILRGDLHGVIPERVSFMFALDGAPSLEQGLAVTPEADDSASIAVRLEPNRVPRNFTYRLKANDAVTPWKTVKVLPPPQLVPLDGRPSPLVHLAYPAYSDLPEQDLPDGGGHVEGVTGTVVSIRAATDRPVVRARVEFAADPPRLVPAAGVFAFAGASALDTVALAVAGQRVWGSVPASIDSTGTRLSVTFQPPISGRYALVFADEAGLTGRRWFDVRMLADPPPAVTLERPSAGRDSLSVLADATVSLQARIEDPVFAVRSAHLEYRAAKDEPAQSLPLYDHRTIGAAVPQLLAPDAPPARLRPQLLVAERRLELQQFKHADGRPLADGDTLTLQVVADDFDDVTSPKPAGRSHEVELRVVNAATLQALVQRAEADVQKELQDLHTLQQDARRRSQESNDQRRTTGRLRPEDMDRLVQSEQMQQQLRQRLGNEQEGLRSAVSRLQQTLRDNPLPKTGERERLDTLAGELDRLGREELPPIEPLIAAARKERETVPSEARKTGPLPKALDHQRESERTLGELLDQLKPWSDARELRADAGMLARELERLNRQRGELMARESKPGENPQNLSTAEREELNRLRERQAGLQERAAELDQKLGSKAQEKTDAAQQKAAEAQAKDAQAAALEKQASEPPAAGTEKAEEMLREARALRQQANDARNDAEALRKEADAIRAARDLARGARQSQDQARADAQAGQRDQAQSGQRDQAKSGDQSKSGQRDQAKSSQGDQSKSGQSDQAQSGQRDQAQSGQRDQAQSGQRDQAQSKAQSGAQNQSKSQARSKNRTGRQDQAKSGQAQGKAQSGAQDQAQSEPDSQPLTNRMREATQRIGENELGKAKEAQDAAARTLQQVQDALAEQADRTDDAERLAKKLRNMEDELENLIEDQERLQKRTEDARRNPDEAQRREALQQLSREQEQLQARARDMAQRLSRQRGEDAAREMRRASRAMEQAREQLEQGEPADERQNDALDRLDDAQDELARARRDAEERLQREQAAKMVDAVKGLRERQESLNTESERILQVVKQKGDWERVMQKSLFDLSKDEQALAGEVERLIESQFNEDRVVSHAVQEAADAMREATAAIDQVKEEDWKIDRWDDDRAGLQVPQKLALRRLDQLLDALKPENMRQARNNQRQQGNRQQGQQGGGEGGEGGGEGGGRGDGLPPLAQLKLLRSLQADLNEQTEAFAKAHPEPAALTERERTKVDKLRRVQSDLAALLDELFPPPDAPSDQPSGEKPDDKPGEKP